MGRIAILAYGSLKRDPGDEIGQEIESRIVTTTPFGIEYARLSTTRGNAPTVVPHPKGTSVPAQLLVLRSSNTVTRAMDMLWRREARRVGSGQPYLSGRSANSVLVKDIAGHQGLDHVLYTDFNESGKLPNPNAVVLARAAIDSVTRAPLGKDGISYLMDLLDQEVETTLTPAYRAEILQMTGAMSLLQAVALKQCGGLLETLKAKIRERAGPKFDSSGYCTTIQDNLVPGVRVEDFEQDLLRGAGNELESKFFAAHSSCALAVNTFASFKNDSDKLRLWGFDGFGRPKFECALPTGLRGTSPTPDVVFRRGTEIWAVESKLLEYFTPTKAVFASSYTKAALPWVEDCWWYAKECAEAAGPRLLDVSQLVKHYFGLSRQLHSHEAEAATLLYLFWEPVDAKDSAVCRQHRAEIGEFAASISNSRVTFRWMAYSELWRLWMSQPTLEGHAGNLMARYCVCRHCHVGTRM